MMTANTATNIERTRSWKENSRSILIRGANGIADRFSFEALTSFWSMVTLSALFPAAIPSQKVGNPSSTLKALAVVMACGVFVAGYHLRITPIHQEPAGEDLPEVAGSRRTLLTDDAGPERPFTPEYGNCFEIRNLRVAANCPDKYSGTIFRAKTKCPEKNPGKIDFMTDRYELALEAIVPELPLTATDEQITSWKFKVWNWESTKFQRGAYLGELDLSDRNNVSGKTTPIPDDPSKTTRSIPKGADISTVLNVAFLPKGAGSSPTECTVQFVQLCRQKPEDNECIINDPPEGTMDSVHVENMNSLRSSYRGRPYH